MIANCLYHMGWEAAALRSMIDNPMPLIPPGNDHAEKIIVTPSGPPMPHIRLS